jgi:hypothetical protein
VAENKPTVSVKVAHDAHDWLVSKLWLLLLLLLQQLLLLVESACCCYFEVRALSSQERTLVWGPSLLNFPFPSPPFFSGPKHQYITEYGKELVVGVGNTANAFRVSPSFHR